jgi:hypothetical protein
MSEWIPLNGVRLQVKHCEDGWGWSAWETQTLGTWRPMRTPAPENLRRRFRTRERAVEFFDLLAQLMGETPIEAASLEGLTNSTTRKRSDQSAG